MNDEKHSPAAKQSATKSTWRLQAGSYSRVGRVLLSKQDSTQYQFSHPETELYFDKSGIFLINSINGIDLMLEVRATRGLDNTTKTILRDDLVERHYDCQAWVEGFRHASQSCRALGHADIYEPTAYKTTVRFDKSENLIFLQQWVPVIDTIIVLEKVEQ